MKIYNVTAESYSKEVEKFSGTVLIDFFSERCTPCKTLSPIIESVATDAGRGVKVCKVNVENEKDLAKKFGIMSVPTLVVLKNGEVKNRSIGVTGKKAILDMLN